MMYMQLQCVKQDTTLVDSKGINHIENSQETRNKHTYLLSFANACSRIAGTVSSSVAHYAIAITYKTKQITLFVSIIHNHVGIDPQNQLTPYNTTFRRVQHHLYFIIAFATVDYSKQSFPRRCHSMEIVAFKMLLVPSDSQHLDQPLSHLNSYVP